MLILMMKMVGEDGDGDDDYVYKCSDYCAKRKRERKEK